MNIVTVSPIRHGPSRPTVESLVYVGGRGAGPGGTTVPPVAQPETASNPVTTTAADRRREPMPRPPFTATAADPALRPDIARSPHRQDKPITSTGRLEPRLVPF